MWGDPLENVPDIFTLAQGRAALAADDHPYAY